LARAFRKELLAARIDSGDEPHDALVAGGRRARGEVVQDFPIQRTAQSPVGARAEGKMPPQRDPLRGLVDGVGLDVRAGERLVVACARLDRHPAVQQQAVPIVVYVGGASQRLVLGDLVHRRNRVAVKSQRVLAEGLHAER